MLSLFDSFEIDQDGPRLVRDGLEVPLEPRALDLLCYLAEHPGRLIRKDELITRVWQAQALSDGVLPNAVSKLRKAFGQGAHDREPIETVRGRGYRFHVGAVRCARSHLGTVRSTPSAPSDPFVGRERILCMLEGSLDRVAGAAGQLVLFSGEAGIGKSRLLDELALRARARGFSVWRGISYAGGGAPACWPWVEIAREALGDERVRRHLPRDASGIATLVPELLGAPPSSDDADALRFRLFDELTRWFAAAAADAPRLIVLDDLQWADATTIELLGHLVRGLARQRVLLAAAVHDHAILPASGAPPEEGPQLAISQLFRSAMHLGLSGLSHSDVHELVRTLGSGEPDARSSRLLHERTHGNPFFVKQLVQWLSQHGLPLARANLDAVDRPPAVRDVIRQRLAALPAETRQLLRTASTFGRKFDAALLARIAKRTLASLLPVLEPALRLGVLRPLDHAPHHFEFRHALVCDELYDELGLAARGDLHARLARALSEQTAGGSACCSGELARHSSLAVPCELEPATSLERRFELPGRHACSEPLLARAANRR